MAGELNLSLAVPAELNPGGIVVRMAGTNEHPLFCVPDLCKVLEISNPSQVVERIDPDDLCQTEVIDAMGRHQRTWFVTEPGFYSLVLKSDKPQAKPFRKWVCGEVLPCIRQHGCYPAPAVATIQQPASPGLALLIRQEIRAAIREEVNVPEMIERECDLINPIEFIFACWPDCGTKLASRIVQRMDTNYIYTLRRRAPKMGLSETAPLMCDREHLRFLTEAIAYFWRKAHRPGKPQQKTIDYPPEGNKNRIAQ